MRRDLYGNNSKPGSVLHRYRDHYVEDALNVFEVN